MPELALYSMADGEFYKLEKGKLPSFLNALTKDPHMRKDILFGQAFHHHMYTALNELAQEGILRKEGSEEGNREALALSEVLRREFPTEWKEAIRTVEQKLEQKERKCRVCGCTEGKACPGGCGWVEWDLCSVCAAKQKGGRIRKQKRGG